MVDYSLETGADCYGAFRLPNLTLFNTFFNRNPLIILGQFIFGILVFENLFPCIFCITICLLENCYVPMSIPSTSAPTPITNTANNVGDTAAIVGNCFGSGKKM